MATEKPKIRPSIYVGLGGTGILAISKTKKMYEDAYGKGNIPSWIAFAAIDFNLAMVNDPSLATDMRDDFIQIKGVGNPKKLYENLSKDGDYTWMFSGNSTFLPPLVVDGAGQVRTNGRFLAEMIISSIENRIKTCKNQITSITNTGNYEVANTDGKIDIHIAMSLAGGTGCGAFLNVAQIIKDNFDSDTYIIGYGVLHGIFRTMDVAGNKSSRVVANAYSAIMDLDYLMHADSNNPISISLNGRTIQKTDPIYDEFYIIDNVTENSNTINDIDKLCEVIGTCLYVAGNELGSDIQGVMSNHYWGRNDKYHISPKKGWVQSLGACQVVYKGDLLADIYGLKAAIEVIRKLQNKSDDIGQKALDWTETVNIREDGDQYNQLISSIYDPKKIIATKMPVLDIKDSITEIKAAVNKYINTLVEFPAEKDITAKSVEITEKLKTKIASLLNAENGVGNSLTFLNSLEKILTGYKSEMESETSVFEKKYGEKQSVLDSKNYKEYEDYAKKLFKSKSGQEERLTELVARPAQQIVKDKLEAERRRKAYDVFTTILAEVAVLKKHIEDIDKKLTNLLNEYDGEKIGKQSRSESTLVFEYDLSYNERLTLELDSRDVVISDYIASLGKSLYDVDLKKDLDITVRTFTSSLKKTNEYRDKLIVDIIENLDDKAYEQMKQEIEKKSSRLLQLDNRSIKNKTDGTFPLQNLIQNYLVSIYSRKNENGEPIDSRLKKDTTFLSGVTTPKYLNTEFNSMKQRIIFYRQDMAIIPYCIRAFDDRTLDKEYHPLLRDSLQKGSTTFNPHFDKNLFEDMKKKDFKLKPEMQDEAILFWICGSIFGWQTIKETKYIMQKDNNGYPQKIDRKEEAEYAKYIRIEKGKYEYWNEEGDSVGKKGKWAPLNNITKRDEAFLWFKTVILPSIKETLKNKIQEELRIDRRYYDGVIDSIIKAGKFDYIDQRICADKNSLTFYSPSNREEGKQLDVEWNYIAKQLKNALSNF